MRKKTLGILLALSVLASTLATPVMAEEIPAEKMEQITAETNSDGENAGEETQAADGDHDDEITPYGAGDFQDEKSYTLEGGGTITHAKIVEEDGTEARIITSCDNTVTSVVIPDKIDGVPVTEIAHGIFQNHTLLESVTIPDSVHTVYDFAFKGCTSLKTVNLSSNMTSINSETFRDCSSLESITIPNSVTSIGGDAFYGCTSLKNVVIPDSVTNIGGYAFFSCTALESVAIPDGIMRIETNTFAGCTSLANFVIPDSVTSIGDHAFYGTSLKNVVIPDGVESIGVMTFRDCSSLKSITIPNSVTSIGEAAFMSCSSLAGIEIPNGVASIGRYAFDGCTSLKNVVIPDSVTDMGEAAFIRCSQLTDITIPGSVTRIGSGAFCACTSLTNVVIQKGVKSIGNSAFEECAMTSITLPDSVTTIEQYAFNKCASLTSIEIPSSVTSIEEGAFYRCNNLKDISFDGTKADWEKVSKGSNAIPNGVTIHCTDAEFTFKEEAPSEVPDSSGSSGSFFEDDEDDEDDENSEDNEALVPKYGNSPNASSQTVNITASSLTNAIGKAENGKIAKLSITSTSARTKIEHEVLDSLTAPVAFIARNYIVTVDPAKLTEKVDIALNVLPHSTAAQSTFEKFFNEPVATISCTQKGSYGGQVYIDIKPDKLSNINVKKPMYVFSWNPKTNSYKRVGTAVELTNGRIRCYTDRGYDLVISNSKTFTAK